MSGSAHRVRAGSLADVEAAGRLVLSLEGKALVLFAHEGRVHVLDNRCPHMGFPLDRGTLKAGILTCHWHHARFDLATGGTFDEWADDVRCYSSEVVDGDVWVDLSPRIDPRKHHLRRLRDGLEHDLPLVLAKAVIGLRGGSELLLDPLAAGLTFGSQFRDSGWGQGLTMLTCFANILELLAPDDRPRALYQGLSAVSAECFARPPRFRQRPLPGGSHPPSLLKAWLRSFAEVRDAEGIERCLASAVAAGASREAIADMLFAAATDHRYLQVGHVMDFTNKAFEALDLAGWQSAGEVLSSLARGLANGSRMEEANSWRNPVDLIEVLDRAFARLPAIIPSTESLPAEWTEPEGMVEALLGDDPEAIVQALLDQLAVGVTGYQLASAVSHAAALRIARFHTGNEFSDWDTALHTFTFANAVHQGMLRAPSVELLRGVFDAAMSVYLDRFLNIPAARIPTFKPNGERPEELLDALPSLFDRQQQVSQAGDLVAQYLDVGGEPGALIASLGGLLLREDRDFHTIQAFEASVRLARSHPRPAVRKHALVAAARYLAAHAPTVRSQEQTFEIALRLSRGERLHEDSEAVVATVLFTDIVDSTTTMAQLGDQRWHDLLDQHNQLVRREIQRFSGRQMEFTGDGFLALFDRPTRAIRCAAAIVDGAAQLGIDVRAGIHTGECEIREQRAHGLTFHIGARIASRADAREVLVSGTVRDLVVGSGLVLVDRGRHELKGVPGEWQVFAVKQ